MPATTTTTTTVVPAVTEVQLVTGNLMRKLGKAVLSLDLTNLHAYLEKLGVPKDDVSKRFANCPQSKPEIIDTVNHAVVPKALCSFVYMKDKPGHIEIDVLAQYQTPPSEDTLNEIAESVKDAAIAVITHYQPVEISISVVGKTPR